MLMRMSLQTCRPLIDRELRPVLVVNDATISFRSIDMKTLIALSVAAAVLLSAQAAEAKGCIKGAIVGGVAGHYAGHHGMLGAAAGCLYGRHRAKQQERDQDRQQQSQDNGRT
ncbi:conserved exported hypothetical protein [Bradyrhizobium sp. STM 3843]|nr:conserved exported hypothetical protein [Bradyrhizobium sp. STM 3843]